MNDTLAVWLDAPFRGVVENPAGIAGVAGCPIAFALEDCRYGFAAARRGINGKMQVLALAAASTVDAQLDRYRAAGWDPVFLDHAGLALWTQSLLETPAALKRGRWCISSRNRLTVVTGAA